MMVAILQPSGELELYSAKVILESLPRTAWPHSSQVRDSAVVESFASLGGRRPSFITSSLREYCNTGALHPTTACMAPDPNKPHRFGLGVCVWRGDDDDSVVVPRMLLW